MAIDFKLLFYIKKTEVKADGTCPIMGRISIGKTMAQFSTKLDFQTLSAERVKREFGLVC